MRLGTRVVQLDSPFGKSDGFRLRGQQRRRRCRLSKKRRLNPAHQRQVRSGGRVVWAAAQRALIVIYGGGDIVWRQLRSVKPSDQMLHRFPDQSIGREINSPVQTASVGR